MLDSFLLEESLKRGEILFCRTRWLVEHLAHTLFHFLDALIDVLRDFACATRHFLRARRAEVVAILALFDH